MKYFDEENSTRQLLETAQKKFVMKQEIIEEMVEQSFTYAEECISAFR